jgi:hypothetical protein
MSLEFFSKTLPQWFAKHGLVQLKIHSTISPTIHHGCIDARGKTAPILASRIYTHDGVEKKTTLFTNGGVIDGLVVTKALGAPITFRIYYKTVSDQDVMEFTLQASTTYLFTPGLSLDSAIVTLSAAAQEDRIHIFGRW